MNNINIVYEPHQGNEDDIFMLISCQCGNWQSQPQDQQRSHLHSFEYDCESDEYKCVDCGVKEKATIEEYQS